MQLTKHCSFFVIAEILASSPETPTQSYKKNPQRSKPRKQSPKMEAKFEAAVDQARSIIIRSKKMIAEIVYGEFVISFS